LYLGHGVDSSVEVYRVDEGKAGAGLAAEGTQTRLG
jgi:hypothetical protein